MAREEIILGYSPDTDLPSPRWLADNIPGFGLPDQVGLTAQAISREVGWNGNVLKVSAAWEWDYARVEIVSPTGEADHFLIGEIEENDGEKIVWQEDPSIHGVNYVVALKDDSPPLNDSSGLIPSEYHARTIADINQANSYTRFGCPKDIREGLPEEPFHRLMTMKAILEKAFTPNGHKTP